MKSWTRIFLTAFLAVYFSFPISASRKTQSPGGWCCLCMCHSIDENKCSAGCIRRQHSKRIIDEPEMKVCTRECLRHGVKQVPKDFQ